MNEQTLGNIENAEQFYELLNGLREQTRENSKKVEALFAWFDANKQDGGDEQQEPGDEAQLEEQCMDEETEEQLHEYGDDGHNALELCDCEEENSYGTLAVVLGLGIAGYGLYKLLR